MEGGVEGCPTCTTGGSSLGTPSPQPDITSASCGGCCDRVPDDELARRCPADIPSPCAPPSVHLPAHPHLDAHRRHTGCRHHDRRRKGDGGDGRAGRSRGRGGDEAAAERLWRRGADGLGGAQEEPVHQGVGHDAQPAPLRAAQKGEGWTDAGSEGRDGTSGQEDEPAPPCAVAQGDTHTSFPKP